MNDVAESLPQGPSGISDRPTDHVVSSDRLDAASRSLPRRRFFDEMPDKGLFAVVSIVGFVSIITLKLKDFNADYIAGFAVALMVCYGTVAYRMPMVQLRLDRLGDNFYYLGFIYTLASLSAALLQLRAGTPIETLLGSFGIALFTTIIGVAGRVLFVQMRGELDEVEAQARRDLLSTSADLRAQLGLLLREFETFHTGVLQATTEAIGRSTEAARMQIDRIGELAQRAADQVDGTFQANQASAQRLGSTVVAISKSVELLADKLTSMDLPSERLEAQIISFGEELESLLTRLGDIVESVARRVGTRRRRKWYWLFLR